MFNPRVWLMVAGLVSATTASAQSYTDWLFFPQLDIIQRQDVEHPSSPESSEIRPAIDVFHSGANGRLRWLAELFFSKDEQDPERLQLGWQVNRVNTVWMGRLHNPIGIWNSRYHHGAFMQTSITRPHLIEYEHNGGFLPSHLSGVLWEGERPLAQGSLVYAGALGFALAAEDKLDGSSLSGAEFDRQRRTVTLKLAYRSSSHEDNELGFFVSRTRLPRPSPASDNVDLTLLGLAGSWNWRPVSLIGNLMWIEDKLIASAQRNDFVSSYLQLEFDFHPQWAGYGRWEYSLGWRGDPYLAGFADYDDNKIVLGLRYDFLRQQTLKLEASEDEHFGDVFTRVALQWSAYFP